MTSKDNTSDLNIKEQSLANTSKPLISAICAVALNRAIGYRGRQTLLSYFRWKSLTS